jgi:P pilus assembly chaperone PapD
MTHSARGLLTAFLLMIPAAASAQGVIVAPHAVYIDHASRAGSITLYNPGDQPVEVSVSFAFGYPKTDSAGSVSIDLVDEPPAGEPGATAWLRAFPRRVTMAPRERQTVRLLASPPSGLPNGEYWARLMVGAKGGQIPVAGVTDTGAVRVGLTLEVRTVIAVVYRKGALSTGLTVGQPTASYAADTMSVRLPMTRTGTAAYLGTVRATVVNAKGDVQGQDELPVAVYYGLDPRLAVPVGTLPAGTYTVRIEVTTARTDLPPRVPLPAPPARDSVMVTVP